MSSYFLNTSRSKMLYIKADETRWRQTMKKQTKTLFPFYLCILGFLFLVNGLSSQQTAAELYEKALYLEEAQGDLQKAIGMYEKILAQDPGDREVAAKAQLHIGLCYEKLGQEQAQAAYQKVVEHYPDQTEAVSMAKEKLLILQKAQVPAETGEGEFRIRRVFPFGTFGSPSLDGKFFSCREDSGDLAIIDIATGKKRSLTNSASWDKGDFVSTSKISPDNGQVAYAWCQNYADLILKIANLDGSGVRVLHPGKMEPREKSEYFWPYDWTPDGQEILGILIKGKAAQINFVSTRDGSFRPIGGIYELGIIPQEVIDLSPDGRWIAYDCFQDEDARKYDIILMSADGSREIPLVKHSASDCLLGWTPDGNSVLFASDRSGSWDAWIIPVKDGKAWGESILVKRNFGQVGGPTGVSPLGFTRDGSFYYEVSSWMEEVHTATLDLEKAAILTPAQKVAQRFEGTNGYADWSPDGKYLAFSSRRGSNLSALCLVSVDTGEQKDIFPPELKTFVRVNWHPDGKSVVVVGGGIHRIDIKSGKASPIVTEGRGFHSPRCTPDGRFVFYENDSFQDNIFRVMRVDLETKEKKEIYRSTQQIIRMDISPDGQSLAFLEPADWTLKVIPLEGGDPRVVYHFREDEWATSVAWSPDGKYLFFSKNSKGEGKLKIELWRIASEGGEPVKFPLVADGMENLRIHPDGKRISFNTATHQRETWVMENFLPETKAPKGSR
jgi:Tol biopolymer transport system component